VRVAEAAAVPRRPPVEAHRQDMDDDEEGVEHHRWCTSGICSLESPHSYGHMRAIHANMLNRDVIVEPHVVVETFEGKLYIGIFYSPQEAFVDGTRFGGVQLTSWHTTCVVAYWREWPAAHDRLRALFVSWRRATIVPRQYQTRMEPVWRVIHPIQVSLLRLSEPPWSRSSTFGLSQPMFGMVQRFSNDAVALVSLDSQFRLRPERPIHTSWR